ncbi:restriction endonuclease subunit S [Aliidiomarina quisquiliarum]|uniref:restriction endonuclease subunit S n=1 Tax=Aliidiomarina quisquiliarum TaxID=2938947 RepID=UPI00208F3CA3|nr:restriction endonuclease subunit S [Aliidiomarina quisquiliarum]MCO4322298.1 restriction endonuclease subunit S [Aliidiomarina quisquiliarum]
MSSEWIDTTLGEVCAAQNGAIQTGPFGSQLHASDYVETGIPVVMPSNIGPDGGISEDGIARIKQQDADRLSQHKLQIGDVVFSRRGDVTRNALIEPHQVGWLCGTGCLKVRLGNETKADAKFISYCLRLPETKEWLIRHAVGATMPNLNTSILSAVPIQIPPIAEQKKITELLRALDDRINLLRETNTTLEAIAQTLFKSWFVDFDPVHANAGSKEATLPPEIQALFPSRFVESEQGLIPEGWEWVYLDELVNVTKGKSYSSEDLVHSNGTALVTLKSFERGGGFRMDGFKPYVGKYKEEQIVLPGDLIVAYTDVTQAAELIGKPAIVVGVEEYDTLVASLDVGIVRPKDSRVSKSFLYGLFCTDDFQIHTYAHTSGSTVLHLAKNAIGSYQALLPCQAIIDEFTKSVCVLEQFKQLNIDKLRLLTNLRDTLLPRLISGQLRLPEVENELEDVI